MQTIYEKSFISGNSHVSCIKYQNLKNIFHLHSDYELIFVNSGTATIKIDDNAYQLSAGQGIFIYSNTIHSISSNENSIISVLKIDSGFFEKTFNDVMLTTPIIKNTCFIESALKDISLELKSSKKYNYIISDSLATQLLVNLFRNEETTTLKRQPSLNINSHILYQEICSKISKEYSTISFSDMAKHLHFSEPYFSKIFHNLFGMTFTQYLNTIKIASAVEKLKEKKFTITEIAMTSGFNTIRNFNRVFKKFTNYAPNELPPNYVFLYSLQNGYGLDPTLNCTIILE